MKKISKGFKVLVIGIIGIFLLFGTANISSAGEVKANVPEVMAKNVNLDFQINDVKSLIPRMYPRNIVRAIGDNFFMFMPVISTINKVVESLHSVNFTSFGTKVFIDVDNPEMTAFMSYVKFDTFPDIFLNFEKIDWNKVAESVVGKKSPLMEFLSDETSFLKKVSDNVFVPCDSVTGKILVDNMLIATSPQQKKLALIYAPQIWTADGKISEKVAGYYTQVFANKGKNVSDDPYAFNMNIDIPLQKNAYGINELYTRSATIFHENKNIEIKGVSNFKEWYEKIGFIIGNRNNIVFLGYDEPFYSFLAKSMTPTKEILKETFENNPMFNQAWEQVITFANMVGLDEEFLLKLASSSIGIFSGINVKITEELPALPLGTYLSLNGDADVLSVLVKKIVEMAKIKESTITSANVVGWDEVYKIIPEFPLYLAYSKADNTVVMGIVDEEILKNKKTVDALTGLLFKNEINLTKIWEAVRTAYAMFEEIIIATQVVQNPDILIAQEIPVKKISFTIKENNTFDGLIEFSEKDSYEFWNALIRLILTMGANLK